MILISLLMLCGLSTREHVVIVLLATRTMLSQPCRRDRITKKLFALAAVGARNEALKTAAKAVLARTGPNPFRSSLLLAIWESFLRHTIRHKCHMCTYMMARSAPTTTHHSATTSHTLDAPVLYIVHFDTISV